MSSQVTELKEKLMSQFAALSEREQRLVGITALVAVVFIFGGGFLLMQSSLKSKEKQIKAQNEQLGQILALESDYNQAKNAQREEMRRLEGKNISLFSLLQNSASELGLSLKDLNEKKSPIKDSEMVQVSVDVNLKEVSIDKLTSFLESIESKSGKGLVKVTRLKTKTRFDNDQLLDVRITVSTWRKAV